LRLKGPPKKNRPNLQIGSVVYCRVSLANKDMEPELQCTSTRNKADGYGELQNGFLFKCSLSLSYQLLSDECFLLQNLGKLVPYEIAVGMNGRVWILSNSNKNTILISNAILNSEFLQKSQCQAMIEKLKHHFFTK